MCVSTLRSVTPIVLVDSAAQNLDLVDWSVVLVGANHAHALHHAHPECVRLREQRSGEPWGPDERGNAPAAYSAKDGMLAVKPRRRSERDEELAKQARVRMRPGRQVERLKTTSKRTCEPFVLGPAFAMDKMPAPVCLSSCEASHVLGLALASVFDGSAASTHPRNLVLELLPINTLAAAPGARRVAPL